MDQRRIVLVHAPLVGPSSWRWVADVLIGHGEDVVVPSLHSRDREPSVATFVDEISRAIGDRSSAVLVGHSGAGVLLPFAAIAAQVKAPTFVFVDAGLPPREGRVRVEAPFREWLGELVRPDGKLPPWHTWWGGDVMAVMVPDAERRRAVVSDIERLPLAYFDEAPEVPAGWTSAKAAYVLLSENYRSWADAATSYGWPVTEVLGTHLELVNRPSDVASAILSAID